MDVVIVAVAAAIVLLVVVAATGTGWVIRVPRLGSRVRGALSAAAAVCVGIAVALRPAGRPSPAPGTEVTATLVDTSAAYTVDTLYKGPPSESLYVHKPSDDPTAEEVDGLVGEDTLWAPTFEGMLGTWTVTWHEGGTQATAWIKELEAGGGSIHVRRIHPGGHEQNVEADLLISGKGDDVGYVADNPREPLNGPPIHEDAALYFTLKHLPNGEWTYGQACVREVCHDVTVLRRPPWTRYDPP